MILNIPDDEKLIFCSMSEKDYEAYMASHYGGMFCDINASPMQSCMCWGFDIPKGWRWILVELCEMLSVLQQKFKDDNVRINFNQIKEKFGSARFYYDSYGDDDSLFHTIVEVLISNHEDKCSYYCCENGTLLPCDDKDIVTVSYCKFSKEGYKKYKNS